MSTNDFSVQSVTDGLELFGLRLGDYDIVVTNLDSNRLSIGVYAKSNHQAGDPAQEFTLEVNVRLSLTGQKVARYELRSRYPLRLREASSRKISRRLQQLQRRYSSLNWLVAIDGRLIGNGSLPFRDEGQFINQIRHVVLQELRFLGRFRNDIAPYRRRRPESAEHHLARTVTQLHHRPSLKGI